MDALESGPIGYAVGCMDELSNGRFHGQSVEVIEL